MDENVKVENGKKEYRNYLVTNMDLMYELADAGLLDKVEWARTSKRDGKTRLFYFEKDERVKEIMDRFYSEIPKAQ